MPDLELKDALLDLASLADTPDLMPAVRRGVRHRRRRRAAGAALASAMTVGAVIAGAVLLSGTKGSDSTPLDHGSPTPTATSRPLPLSARVPAYVPPGVHVSSRGPGGAEPATAGVYHVTYKTNRATITFVVIDDRRLPPCPTGEPSHVRHVRAPCGTDTGWLFPFSPLAAGYDQVVNGRTAHVADEQNHFGVQDVEWREGPYHYVLSSERLNLSAGPSGVPFAELVRMARSVPADASVPAEEPLPNPPDVAVPASLLDGYQRYDRRLIDGNGASISYSRLPRGEFSIYIVPPGVTTPDAGSPNALGDIDPARAKAEGAKLVHLTVRGEPATGWRGPGDFVGLRAQIDGFTVGFLGRYGITLADYERIASALRVVPHEP